MRLTAVGGILALATASLALNVTLILVLASPFAWGWKAVLTLISACYMRIASRLFGIVGEKDSTQ
jgi:hypothetical protein